MDSQILIIVSPNWTRFFAGCQPLNHTPETIRYGPMGPWVTLAVEDVEVTRHESINSLVIKLGGIH